VVFCIRPENVTLAFPPHLGATSARNVFPGRIVKIVPLGLYYRIHLDCGFLLVAYVTIHSLENLSLNEGKEIVASFKATAIHVIRKTKKSEPQPPLSGQKIPQSPELEMHKSSAMPSVGPKTNQR
jgi:tungstate transport system ATP-binding protein